MFENKKIKDYNEILASNAPTPGGGSALAMVGAKACALIEMAVNISMDKIPKPLDLNDWKTEQIVHKITYFVGLKNKLNLAINKMYQLADEDAQAFEKILVAMRLPKTTEEEKKHRQSTLQKEYHKAALVPLELMANCNYIIEFTKKVLDYLYDYVASDAHIGISLLECVVKNSQLNVLANTNLIKDEELKKQLEGQARLEVAKISH